MKEIEIQEKELHDFIENELVEDCWWDNGSDIFKKYASELLKDKKMELEYIKKMFSDLFNVVEKRAYFKLCKVTSLMIT